MQARAAGARIEPDADLERGRADGSRIGRMAEVRRWDREYDEADRPIGDGPRSVAKRGPGRPTGAGRRQERRHMAWSEPQAKVEGRRFPRVLGGVEWLRARRDLVIALAVAGIAASFILDLVIPGYAIAGFYLLPLLLVVFALHGRRAVVLVSVVCLSLTVCAMVLQGRTDAQNILLVWFGALAGAGLIALGYLYNSFDDLYQTERSTTARLHSLTAQLQRLQEVSVLDSDRPLSELLLDIVVQARQFLGSDGARLFRLETPDGPLSTQATIGLTPFGDADASLPLPLESGAVGQALAARRAVAATDLDGGDRSRGRSDCRACLAVPLVVRDDVFGVIALYYSAATTFDDHEVGLAASFGDQAALAIENARLREQMERSAVAAERSRLARELHDSVTQSLFAASLTAEALVQDSDPASDRARQGLRDVQRLTRGALAEMRTLLLEMRPGALAQSSLDDLLAHVVQAAEARTRTSIALTVDDDLRPLPADVTIALYRIAQEATNNMVRHAHARRAWMTLTHSDEAVRLAVGDDGEGFDRASVGAEQLGLRIMRERAEAVGAHLEITGEVGGGTLVHVVWSAGQGAEL
jgi:signal transduction histidine kinase